MRKTNQSVLAGGNRLTVDTEELKALIGCGRSAATQIGEAAGAKIKFGRRIFWNIAKIQKFLDEQGA